MDKSFFHVEDAEQNIYLSNIDGVCHECMAESKPGAVNSKICKLTGRQHTFKKESVVNGGTMYYCTGKSSDQSFRRFKEKFNLFKELSEGTVRSGQSKLTELDNKRSTLKSRYERLIHNLVSYNASAMQSLYKLIPQEDFVKGGEEQIEFIRDIVCDDPRETSKTLLRLLKNMQGMKSEFSIFSILSSENPKVELFSHHIHKIVTLVLNAFWLGFIEKGINLNIGSCEEEVLIDYGTTTAALNLVFENALKYTSADTRLTISFEKKDKELILVLDMVSLKILEEEADHIFEERVSGNLPKKLGIAGKGLGLSMAKKLLELNKASIDVETNVDPSLKKFAMGSVPYENNHFIICFKCK